MFMQIVTSSKAKSGNGRVLMTSSSQVRTDWSSQRGERRDLVMFTKPSCLPMVKVVFVLHSKHHIFPVVLLPVFQCSFFRYSLNVQFLFHVYLDERTAGLFCTKRKKKKKKRKAKNNKKRWKLISFVCMAIWMLIFLSMRLYATNNS